MRQLVTISTRRLLALIIAAVLVSPLSAGSAQAADASIYFSPSGGQYTVGGTLDVSVIVNTGSHSINAIEVEITFPEDKLQAVSPSVGSSFVTIWTTPPNYSNTNGTLNFTGGLPTPGIKSSAAILTTVRFRIRASGTATLAFQKGTKILANDGSGTDVLTSKNQATLTLVPAAPNGPVVTSVTHPDQNTWYSDKTASFSWEAISDADGYSWVVDGSAKTTPPENIRTTKTEVTEAITQDGIWYFHVRSGNGTWGGTTHYLFKVDSLPPAAFTPTLNKESIEAGETAIVSFFTTDAASGVDHYEIKTINTSQSDETVTLFHEETSPFELPALPEGEYAVIVRAYDQAGNYTDGSVELSVSKDLFPIITALKRIFGDPAGNVFSIINIALLAILIGLTVYWAIRRHRRKVQQALLTPAPAIAPGAESPVPPSPVQPPPPPSPTPQ